MWELMLDPYSRNIHTYPLNDSFGGVPVKHETDCMYVASNVSGGNSISVHHDLHRIVFEPYVIKLVRGPRCTCDVDLIFRQSDPCPGVAFPMGTIQRKVIAGGFMEIRLKPEQIFYLPSLDRDYSIQIIHNSWDGRENSEEEVTAKRRLQAQDAEYNLGVYGERKPERK